MIHQHPMTYYYWADMILLRILRVLCAVNLDFTLSTKRIFHFIFSFALSLSLFVFFNVLRCVCELRDPYNNLYLYYWAQIQMRTKQTSFKKWLIVNRFDWSQLLTDCMFTFSMNDFSVQLDGLLCCLRYNERYILLYAYEYSVMSHWTTRRYENSTCSLCTAHMSIKY